jgi:hypothetical protein
MQVNPKDKTSSKFPLRLMPSVRKGVERFSQREGVSLNQFINVALAEKLAHLQHDEWLAQRPQPTDAKIARALEILDRPMQNPPTAGDELPSEYVPVRKRTASRQVAHAK